jgi:tetratricopeptide (TPR) repeat protein
MTAKRLNTRPLLYAAVAVLALTAATHLVHGRQMKRLAERARAEADRAEAEGRTELAMRGWARYLTFVPDDPEGLVHYALALDREGGPPATRRRALSALRRALAREPACVEARRRLVAVAMELGQFGEARQHLQALLRATPGQAELEETLSRCEAAEGDFAHAAESLHRAVRLAPDWIEIPVCLAELLRNRLDDPDLAAQVMDKMVIKNVACAPAYLARARYRFAAGAPKGAAEDLARAADLAPEDAEVIAANAEWEERRGDLEAARANWERGEGLHPAQVRMCLGLAGVECKAGRLSETAGCLRRGLGHNPGQPDLLLALVEVLTEHGDLPGAGEAVARLREQPALSAVAAYGEGLVLMRQKRWREAGDTLERAARGSGLSGPLRGRIYLHLARCYEQVGYEDRQLATTRAAAAADPTAAARSALAGLLLAAGRPDEAAEEYRALAALPDAPHDAGTQLARALLRHNLTLAPRQRNMHEVTRALDRAADAPGQTGAVAALRAELLLAEGQAEEGRAVLEAARRQYPKELTAWTASADLAWREGRPAEALRLLEQAGTQLGERLELRLARADLWARHGGPIAARMLDELAESLESYFNDDQMQLLLAVAERQAWLGNRPEVVRLCREIVARRPDDLRGRLLLVEVSVIAGNDRSTRRAIDELLRVEGETGTCWRYGEAARLLAPAAHGDRSGLAQARALQEEVARQRPGWARVPALLARLEEAEGRPDRALAAYLRAIELGDRGPAVLRRAAQLLKERGRPADADDVLRKAVDARAADQGHWAA